MIRLGIAANEKIAAKWARISKSGPTVGGAVRTSKNQGLSKWQVPPRCVSGEEKKNPEAGVHSGLLVRRLILTGRCVGGGGRPVRPNANINSRHFPSNKLIHITKPRVSRRSYLGAPTGRLVSYPQGANCLPFLARNVRCLHRWGELAWGTPRQEGRPRSARQFGDLKQTLKFPEPGDPRDVESPRL